MGRGRLFIEFDAGAAIPGAVSLAVVLPGIDRDPDVAREARCCAENYWAGPCLSGIGLNAVRLDFRPIRARAPFAPGWVLPFAVPCWGTEIWSGGLIFLGWFGRKGRGGEGSLKSAELCWVIL